MSLNMVICWLLVMWLVSTWWSWRRRRWVKPGGSKWVRNCGSVSAALVLKGIDKAHPKTLSGLAHLKCRSIAVLLSDRVSIHCFVNTLSCQRTQHNVLAKVKPRPFDLCQVVKSWVKITKDYYKIWFQIWKLLRKIQLNSFCLQYDYWMLWNKCRKLSQKGFWTKE